VTAVPDPIDRHAADRLLTTTRAVRRRLDLDRPVDRSVVVDCLRIAIQAPTAGNEQLWRWMVVDDPALRMGLAELYRRSFAGYIGERKELLADAGLPVDNLMVRSAEFLAEHLHEVPVLVVPCLAKRVPLDAPTMEHAALYGSIVPAAWSFMLALRSRGLGAAYTTLHLAYEREAAELLGIPDSVTQVALMPVAYTVGDDFRPAARRPVEEVTYLNRWRNKVADADGR